MPKINGILTLGAYNSNLEMLGKLNRYLIRLGIFLITAALIAGMAGCGLTSQYNLTIALAPGGSGTATDLTNASPYAAGTVVNITTAAVACYQFVNWTAPAGTFGSATAMMTTFTMPAQDVTVTANFAPLHRCNLTMAADPAVGGTATDLTNASPYTACTVVNITAVAAAGYQFVNWMAPAGTFGSATAATTTFTMPCQDVTVTANFKPPEFYGGNGTAGDPYQIADWHQLNSVRDYPSSHFILINDLDSTTAGYTKLASPTSNGGKGWQPIASFRGSFDGQGYETRDLFINRPGENYVGLFGFVDDGGHIENIGVVNVNVIGDYSVGGLVGEDCGTVSNSYSTGSLTGRQFVGGLVGYARNSSAVSNSYFTGTVTGDSNVGGLVGRNMDTVSNSYSNGNVSGTGWAVGGLAGVNNGNVSDSYATGSVTGNTVNNCNVGGLVGANYETVSNCYATSSVTGSSEVGGLVGVNGWDGGIVTNSYSTGSVTGDESVGGLIGCNVGIVSDSYATGSVTGNVKVGGLVGYNYYGKGTVSNSYSTGNVTGNLNVGGLVGWNKDGFVSNSYSTGNVTGTSNVGGLVGQNSGTVSNSFWDTETSGQATSHGGTGKDTTEMQDITTFSGTGWNIIAVALNETNPAYIWNIVNNVTYPFLSWQP
jgi:uncharacterized repeat protein (TIGR02543 family)